MKTLSTFLLLLLSGFCTCLAQSSLLFRGPSISAGAQIAIPDGDFSKNITGTPVGLQAYVSMPILGLPIESGFNFSWNRIDKETRDVQFNDDAGAVSSGEIAIKQNIYRYMFTARLRPFNKGFRPYGEVLGGLAHHSSKSELTAMTFDGHENKPVMRRMVSSIALTYGWAAGVQIRLIPAVFLEVRYERLQGNSAQYLNPKSLQLMPDGRYNFSSAESETDIQTATLGLTFSF